MRPFGLLFSVFVLTSKGEDVCKEPKNQCVQFTVGSGTGCVGSPVAGKTYTCCST